MGSGAGVGCEAVDGAAPAQAERIAASASSSAAMPFAHRRTSRSPPPVPFAAAAGRLPLYSRPLGRRGQYGGTSGSANETRGRLYAVTFASAITGTSEVQKAQRVALIGMLLRQKGQSRVVGSTGSSVLRRAMSALIGRTTKKKTTAAMIRNETTALMKSPIRNLLVWMVK